MDRDKAGEMLGEVARKTEHRLHHRHAALPAGKVRAGKHGERFQRILALLPGKIEAMGDRRDGRAWSGGKAAQIEGQPVAQQFEPHLVLRSGAACAMRPALAGRDREFHSGPACGIVAQKHALLASHKIENRGARGPLAGHEQQMQPCGPGVLRQ